MTEIIVQLVANLGVTGVLVWYLWHTTTKTMPDLMKEHKTQVAELAAHQSELATQHTAAAKQMSAEFLACLEKERDRRTEEIAAMRESLPTICQFWRTGEIK